MENIYYRERELDTSFDPHLENSTKSIASRTLFYFHHFVIEMYFCAVSRQVSCTGKLMKTFAAVMILLVAFPSGHARGEEFGFTQTMRLFGRALLPADKVALGMAGSPENLSEQDLQEAVQGIDVAIKASEKILHVPCEAALQPSRARALSEADFKIYSQKYNDLMVRFIKALQEYKVLIEQMATTAPQDRRLEPLNEKRLEIRELARISHTQL